MINLSRLCFNKTLSFIIQNPITYIKVIIIEFLSTSHTKIAYALILIITFPLWSRYSLYTHSLIDVPFGIFSIILITLIFFNHQSWFKKGKDNNYDLYLLSILFFLLFTIKSSGILFFPLLI